jgi:hypothetical protein
MKHTARLLALSLAAAPALVHGAPGSEFCPLLREFVKSVAPDEDREFAFHTSWGGNFKDDPEPVIFAKRCSHHGYAPAEKVCEDLMRYGSTEFAGYNAKRAITCLSRGTRFANGMELNSGSFSFSYGSANRGALIEIVVQEDPELGGMVFRLLAKGY